MKILFIENRYKTIFWEAIAKELKKSGHEIFWIVQNHYFKPIIGTVYTVPYPKNEDLFNTPATKDALDLFEFIQSTDRIVNYFGGNTRHYPYYYKKFTEIIENVKPDLAIGESTLFHELLIIDICKKNELIYLNPSSSSYPPGRYSFYSYDTKTPLYGSNKQLTDHECDQLIEAISSRNVVPDYMKSSDEKSPYPKPGSLKNRLDIILSYIQGEKHNTPSPLKKFLKDYKTKKIQKIWNSHAVKNIDVLNSKKIILFPLQLQPEANLDVWGNKYKDQSKLIKDLPKNLSDNWVLVVKPNPKSKYEMNEELLNTVLHTSNILPLHSSMPMKDIFDISDIVVTVSGTVAIESVLSGKPLGLLGPSAAEGIKGCRKMESPDELKKMIDLVNHNGFEHADIIEKRKLVRKLVNTTCKGIVSDPMSSPECMNEMNISLVANAIDNILNTEFSLEK